MSVYFDVSWGLRWDCEVRLCHRGLMGNSQSKVELYAAIRRDHDAGMSQRGLQHAHNVTWRTARRALDGQWPEPRKKPRRKESRLDPYKPLIDEILRAALDAPRKQREEKNSVAIASNESFSGWTKTFTDTRLCAAIVDRLTFNGAIIQTGAESYRLAHTKAQAERAVI